MILGVGLLAMDHRGRGTVSQITVAKTGFWPERLLETPDYYLFIKTANRDEPDAPADTIRTETYKNKPIGNGLT